MVFQCRECRSLRASFLRLLPVRISYFRFSMNQSFVFVLLIRFWRSTDRDGGFQVPISLLPAVVGARHADAHVAINASLPIFIFLAFSLDVLFAAPTLDCVLLVLDIQHTASPSRGAPRGA